MGMGGMRYPDGGAPLDQPVLLLDAFRAIGAAKSAVKAERDGV